MIDKKNVLDHLYILKNALIEKAQKENSIALEKQGDVCLNNLALGRGDGYEKSWILIDDAIRIIIEME